LGLAIGWDDCLLQGKGVIGHSRLGRPDALGSCNEPRG
jgi:hypothetical protein